MARFSKHKISRRFGIDIYGTGGPSLQRRLNIPPGGIKSARQRKSEYAKQIAEKQKVKYLYGVRERQFLRYFGMALRSDEPSGQVLLLTLERRLDNALYRLGFARHLVSYGHVTVNEKRIDKPSYLVKPGETITLTANALRIPEVQEELKAQSVPCVAQPGRVPRTNNGPAGARRDRHGDRRIAYRGVLFPLAVFILMPSVQAPSL